MGLPAWAQGILKAVQLVPTMDLTTRCPQCETTFKASLEQLQLRKGYIRCVHCGTIFDGYEAVVPVDPGHERGSATPAPVDRATAAARAPSGAEPQVPDVVRQRAVGAPVHTVSDASTNPPSVVRDRRRFTVSGNNMPQTSAVEPSLHSLPALPDTIPPHAAHRSEPVFTGAAVPAVDRTPHTVHTASAFDEVRPGQRPQQPRTSHDSSAARSRDRDTRAYTDSTGRALTLMWTVLVFAGAVLLVAQLVYVFRVQIAQAAPALRPALERACASLNCTVSYSRRPDKILITHSSLQLDTAASDTREGKDSQPQDTTSETHFLLQATLRNTYDKPQEWPTLVLELTDAAGAHIARRNLPADVWLPEDIVAGPFPAGSEYTLHLPLTLQGLQVNGYQLTTFFP